MAAILAVTAMSMPVALLTSRTAIAAAAATTTAKRVAQPAASVAITITSMTPRQAAPGSTITVTGMLKNVSQQQISHLAVRLLSSGMRLTSLAQLQAGASGPYGLLDRPVPGASSLLKGQLQPGTAVPWSIRAKANAISMTTFGVYPLTVQAQSTLADVLPATSTTYLPYVPAKKGPYGSSIPARTKISWVWPLIDKPLLSRPGQSICQGAQAQALAASLGSGGRLNGLVEAGAHGARTAMTWAIDPALLADAKALADCGSSQPKWAAAARNWLARLRQLSSGRPVFLTPYGDPSVAALIEADHPDDVRRAFDYGRAIGGTILNAPMSAAAGPGARAAHGQTAQGQTASIAWPADGRADYTVLEHLAANDGVQTLLLGSSYLPAENAAVLRTPTGSGGYMNILLANESLTRLLGTGGSTGDSAFAAAQEVLAETALLAELNPSGKPIVVAPPQRWLPAPRFAADLLATTGSASWLSPVSLASLTSPRNLQVLQQSQLPADPTHGKLGRSEIRVLGRVDNKIAQLKVLKASPDSVSSGRPPGCADPVCDYLAVAAAESSAWHGKSKHVALAALRALEQRIAQQLRQGVQVEAEQRITLGGLKGSVPVSIDNTLSFKVHVRLKVDYDQSTGIKITVSPAPGVVSRNGLVTIPAHNVVTVRLRVQATEVGATEVTLSLQNSQGTPLFDSPSQRMTIQATQVGVLGVIIFAVALGVFLIATAARAARRGRPAPATEQAADPGLAAERAGDRPAAPPEPDTVMAERTELGAAGPPGRD